MASLTIKNINKTFGQVKAVQDVSLDVKDGEFIALLGPSGCGKTTTLRMVAGLESCDSGQIFINQQDATNLEPRDRDVAMVFQDYALYPHMTVLENVGYPLKVRGVNQAELKQRVSQVASELQIDGLLERRPAQLSGGQQQRVALARAVVHKANLTLYDEPLSNLDTKLRIEARAFLKHLQRSVGATSLYVTHDQAEALALADRILVMSQGKIMQLGTPMEIYHRPANTTVAAFIGSPPMNLLDGVVDQTAQVLRVEALANIPLEGLHGAATLTHNQRVKLGIRPEHIRISTTAQEAALPAQLYVIQELGSETLAIFHINRQIVAVRLYDENVPDASDAMWLVLQRDRIFLYNEEGNLIV